MDKARGEGFEVMRDTVRAYRQSQLTRIALVVVVAGVAAGCSSNSVRLSGGDLFAGSAADAPIESADLGTLDSAGTAAAAQTTPITTPASLRQRGWSVEGAPIVEVTAGDSAASLSQGFGVPVSVILEANGLADAEQVRPGQRLVIPTYVYRERPDGEEAPSRPETAVATGPVEPARGAPARTLDEQAREGRHVVQPGDTLDSIATSHRVTRGAVAQLNGLPENAAVRPGQVLRIPEPNVLEPSAPQTQVAAADPAPRPDATVSDASPETAPASGERQVAAISPAQVAPGDAGAASDGADGFRWPVRGRIISGFGKQPDGARNDGINLAVPAGTPVHASEAGTVIYAGNELEGYGNLILIQHQDDWVSAYAHNETLKVNRGDKVRRGQVIASVGATGAVDTPQLHFELRKRSKPVDPLPHLTGA